jgi:hypothetical protein
VYVVVDKGEVEEVTQAVPPIFDRPPRSYVRENVQELEPI